MKRPKKNQGYTLVEAAIVVALLGFLSLAVGGIILLITLIVSFIT